MSLNSGILWSKDPRYGKIRDLCSALGYSSEVRGTARFWHSLRDPTARHRQKFMRSPLGSSTFSLDCNAPEVQLCASTFLESEHHLFGDTLEAQVNAWPIYPQDRELILVMLAKLMCTQELYAKRNNTSAEGRTSYDHNEGARNDPTDNTRNTRRRPRRDSLSSSSNIVGKQGEVMYISTEEDTDSESEERESIQQDIDWHLQYTYPLSSFKESMSRDWLFETSARKPFPDDVKRYIFRYLHEHQLYNVDEKDPTPMNRFVHALREQLRIEYDVSDKFGIYKKCQRQVSYNAKRWFSEFGFLETCGPVYKRTREFEMAWKARYNRWQEYHSLVDVSREDDQPTSSLAGRKRSLPASPSERISQAGEKTGCPAAEEEEPIRVFKRSKVDNNPRPGDDAIQLGSKGLQQPDLATTFPDGQDPANASVSQQLDHNAEFRDLTVDMPCMVSANSIPSDKEKSIELSINPLRRTPSSPPPLPSVFNTPQSNASNGTTTTPITAEHILLSSSIRQVNPGNAEENPHVSGGKASDSITQPGLSGSGSLEKSFDITEPSLPPSLPPSLRSAPAPASTPTTKAKLEFILEKRKGLLDRDHPISPEEWWGYNLAEIFALVSTKSNQPEAELSCLTLRCIWGSREAFLVNRHLSGQDWKEIKDMIREEFLTAREEMPEKDKFQIWVKSGDTTYVRQDESW